MENIACSFSKYCAISYRWLVIHELYSWCSSARMNHRPTKLLNLILQPS